MHPFVNQSVAGSVVRNSFVSRYQQLNIRCLDHGLLCIVPNQSAIWRLVLIGRRDTYGLVAHCGLYHRGSSGYLAAENRVFSAQHKASLRITRLARVWTDWMMTQTGGSESDSPTLFPLAPGALYSVICQEGRAHQRVCI